MEKFQPNDPYYRFQNHLRDLGDIERVWARYTGDGVTIGVYDLPVETVHPDLIKQLDAELHFDDAPDAQSLGSFLDARGTLIAGILAAESDNKIGISGIAPEARLGSVPFADPSRPDEKMIALEKLSYGRAFDVINLSVSYLTSSVGFGQHQNIFAEINQNDMSATIGAAYYNTLKDLAHEGRDGLGTVVVKNVGGFAEGSREHSARAQNAMQDPINNAHESIVVAGVFQNHAIDGTGRGSHILLSATTAAISTDLTGSRGLNDGESSSFDGDYFWGLVGSEFATPVVSGVVALMQEANSNLGWRDIQNILVASVQDAGALFDPKDPEGWRTSDGNHFNGGGYLTHNSFGYGRVDALAAVQMAESWAYMRPVAQSSANMAIMKAQASPDYIHENNTLRAVVEVDGSLSVEHIYVSLALELRNTQNISLFLTSPGGSRFELLEEQIISTDAITIGLAHARGLDAKGNWHIEISGEATEHITLTELSLQFEGAANHNDDIHHITDEIWRFSAELPSDALMSFDGRSTLRDENGGVDWLNFSAFTGAVTADLLLREVSLYGEGPAKGQSRKLDISENSAFEHIVGSEGNDTLTGNFADQTLVGGRGDDVLIGHSGGDHLIGGQGHDRVSYETATEQVALNLLGVRSNRGDAQGDILESIEAIQGSHHDDDLRGSHQRDVIIGGRGHDWIMGQNGRDMLIGASGDDVLLGGQHADHLIGGRGDDRLVGGAGEDRLIGGAGANTFLGGDGADFLLDGSGDGVLYAGSGDDTLIAGLGNDSLQGGDGDDTLSAGGGSDILMGESGNDHLIGDEASQEIRGADIFVFDLGMGRDVVLDFTPQEGDRLRISGALMDGRAPTELLSTEKSGAPQAMSLTFSRSDHVLINGSFTASELINAIEVF